MFSGLRLWRVSVISTSSLLIDCLSLLGMIVAFSIPVSRAATSSAGMNRISIVQSAIIYQVINQVRQLVIDLLPPTFEKHVTGEATALQIFDIHLPAKRIRKVAGSRITSGVLEKASPIQVLRNGIVVHEGQSYTAPSLCSWNVLLQDASIHSST